MGDLLCQEQQLQQRGTENFEVAGRFYLFFTVLVIGDRKFGPTLESSHWEPMGDKA